MYIEGDRGASREGCEIELYNARTVASGGWRGAQDFFNGLPADDANGPRAVQDLVGAFHAHGHVSARHQQSAARFLEAHRARFRLLWRERLGGRRRRRDVGAAAALAPPRGRHAGVRRAWGAKLSAERPLGQRRDGLGAAQALTRLIG